MHTRKHIEFLLSFFRAQQVVQPLTNLAESDWSEVVQLAIRQRMAPLLYAQLKTFPAQVIPDSFFKRLEREYLNSAMTNMVIFTEFSRVFNLFQENDLPFIALKGAHLAEMVYSDPALRILTDLDILVREMDVSRAASLLMRIGYAPWDKTVADPADHHLPPFVKSGTVPVEIHWGLHRVKVPARADIVGLWERAVPAKLGSGKALVLSVEDLLLHLSLHASQHDFDSKLSSIYDIHEIIRSSHSQINWKELEARAHRWGAGKALFLMLLLSVDLLGTAVPIGFLERIRPADFAQDFLEFARVQMFADTKAVSERMAEMYRTRRLSEKIRILIEILFCPSKCSDKNRPVTKSARLLYPLRRLKSLLRSEYGRSMWQMRHADEKELILTNPDAARTLKNWLLKV